MKTSVFYFGMVALGVALFFGAFLVRTSAQVPSAAVTVDGDDLGRDIELALGISSGEMILVDSAARGGTGRSPSWARLAQLATPAKMILAGGLDQDNVGEVVSMVRPYGVDVSTGIEKAPGEKDPERMRAFVTAARAAQPRGEMAR